MKKKMMMLAFGFPAFIHGMEQDLSFSGKLYLKQGLLAINITSQTHIDSRNELQWRTFYKTKIKVLQEPILHMDDKIDLIVVGENQQRIMRDKGTSERMKYRKDQVVYVDNNGSITKKTMKSKIWNVMEPKIRTDIQTSGIQDVSSTYVRKHCILPDCKDTKELFFNDQALKEALKDLELCYACILDLGWVAIDKVKRENGEERPFPGSIAIPILSTKFGFSTKMVIAIVAKVVTEFVKKYPRLYKYINLYTTEKSEIEEYERLMGSLLSK